jgi:hypothetical protein
MIECHKEIICIPDLPKESLELSMGMSSDYEHAVIFMPKFEGTKFIFLNHSCKLFRLSLEAQT